ncbi:MerR family DNA-binding protein [Geopsychrobacter electrodiphilus]|uniref:MerR family DNA-binding protein n=1 Tax=Geopsychrobacter electrodiphilus TaxID=225196 RepID=UPI0003736A60|nr:MerR family DNA-binding protein [Geopsychrobacter electrodiphilus]
MLNSLTIGRLAKKAEVSIDSIRFYERKGLLAEPLRTESNYRVYPLETAVRLRFIKKAQNLGFSLNEIQELLELQQNPAARKSEVKAKTAEKIKAIHLKIQDLSQMLGVLEHLSAACDGLGSIDKCPILEGLATDDSQKCHH